MKNFTLSAVAVLAMSASAIAGGDFAPVVEPIIEIQEVPVVNDNGFYVGLAYGYADISDDYIGSTEQMIGAPLLSSGNHEDSFNTYMLQAGYKFNQYFAVEGRYWDSIGDGDWTDRYTLPNSSVVNNSGPCSEFSAWGLYVKPMYPVTEEFDVYALLGYGNVDLSTEFGRAAKFLDMNEDGFQWGLGVSYELTDNLAIFADYVNLYNDNSAAITDGIYTETHDYSIYTANVGVTYKF